MSIFANEDDAIRFAIRRIYHDVLHRQIESPQVQDTWLAEWKKKGGDVVLAQIMDGKEGQEAIAATRKALGLP